MSPDEELTRDVVLGEHDTERPAAVVVAASAVNLARSLYLVAQIRETDLPVVLALTMSDVAARRGIRIDPDALGAALGCSVVALDPRRRRGHEALTVAVSAAVDGGPVTPRRADPGAHEIDPDLDPDGELARGDERFACIERAVDAATHHTGETRRTHSDRIDRWVTAPVAGPLIFLAVMWVLFQITTRVAAPLQDGLGALVNGPVSSLFTWLISSVGLGDTWVQGLVVDGLVAGVGMLLTFVPLMALMFLLLALLEDSGYLARAAVVTDRLMGRLGLPGRAFLPLVVGFGCNVPAISATRILPQARHRILTALLVPFTSCSARLTVYMLLATTFFPRNAGSVVFAMYVVSILLVVLVGLLLRSTLWRTMGAEPLVIDLPPYQRPTVRLTTSVMWLRLKGFLRTASGIIVATVVVVWLLQSIAVTGGAAFGHVPVADSLYAAVAGSSRRSSPRPGSASGRRSRRSSSGSSPRRRSSPRGRRPTRSPSRRRPGRRGRSATTCSRRSRPPRVGTPGSPSWLHGVPARLHPVRGHPGGPAPRARHPVDGVRRRHAARRRLAAGGPRLPGRKPDVVRGRAAGGPVAGPPTGRPCRSDRRPPPRRPVGRAARVGH